MSKQITIGNISIGNGQPIAIQSMTNTDTKDTLATISQIKRLQTAGCQIARVAIYDSECLPTLRAIKEQLTIPIVADIHYDYKLAIASIENGADKVRLNPGNIGSKENVIKVINVAKKYGVPIRVGVNGGSLPVHLYDVYAKDKYRALFLAVKEQVDILEEQSFNNIVISAKCSNVVDTITINKLLNESYDYPLHIGVTEAGTYHKGAIKSAVAFGALLSQGIGDTIRVSLTDDPVNEILVAKEILQSLGKYPQGIDIISCPTCGRTNVDIIAIAKEVEEKTANLKGKLTVAIMGCGVNGPNEAKHADVGIAGGIHEALLFKKGKIIKKIKEEDIVNVIMEEIHKLIT